MQHRDRHLENAPSLSSASNRLACRGRRVRARSAAARCVRLLKGAGELAPPNPAPPGRRIGQASRVLGARALRDPSLERASPRRLWRRLWRLWKHSREQQLVQRFRYSHPRRGHGVRGATDARRELRHCSSGRERRERPVTGGRATCPEADTEQRSGQAGEATPRERAAPDSKYAQRQVDSFDLAVERSSDPPDATSA